MTELKIEGMSCGHCVAAVREAIAGVPEAGVGDVRIGSARIEGPPGVIDRVRAAIEEEGYRVVASEPA